MTSPPECGASCTWCCLRGPRGPPTQMPGEACRRTARGRETPSLQPASGQQGGGFEVRPRPGPRELRCVPSGPQCPPGDSSAEAPERPPSGACRCQVSWVRACHSTDRQARSQSGGVRPSKHVLGGREGGDGSLTNLGHPCSSRTSLTFLYDGGPQP